jgi:hypothetical protein
MLFDQQLFTAKDAKEREVHHEFDFLGVPWRPLR